MSELSQQKPPKKRELVLAQVQEERYQGHSTRTQLYSRIEDFLGIPVIAFFTSFVYPAVIEDNDADMLEGLLQKCNVSKGFALLLSSPGGYGLAAERIINVCRSYSGTGKYQVIVPGKAKSAATIICLGASKLVMGNTSELGAIDPQAALREGDADRWYSLFNIVKSYESLFEKAVKEKRNLQPYMQQLANYDERQIAEYKSELALSEDMAIKALKAGMLSHLSKEQIKKRIRTFLTPESVKVHGRPIYAADARRCGLEVEIADMKSPFWYSVYELYVRLNTYVSSNGVVKCVECKDDSFKASAGVSRGEE